MKPCERQVGASVCTLCDKGTYQASLGRSSCDRCSPGRFTASTGHSACESCRIGKYQDESGQSLCKDCQNILSGAVTTRSSAASSQYDCGCHEGYLDTRGYNPLLEAPSCIPCPEGLACTGATTLLCPSGAVTPTCSCRADEHGMACINLQDPNSGCPTGVECIGNASSTCPQLHSSFVLSGKSLLSMCTLSHQCMWKTGLCPSLSQDVPIWEPSETLAVGYYAPMLPQQRNESNQTILAPSRLDIMDHGVIVGVWECRSKQICPGQMQPFDDPCNLQRTGRNLWKVQRKPSCGGYRQR